jgi:hypothetical protein
MNKGLRLCKPLAHTAGFELTTPRFVVRGLSATDCFCAVLLHRPDLLSTTYGVKMPSIPANLSVMFGIEHKSGERRRMIRM